MVLAVVLFVGGGAGLTVGPLTKQLKLEDEITNGVDYFVLQ